MDILSFIVGIFKPATDLINNMHTSTEEKLTLKNKLTVIENTMAAKVIDYETKLLAAKTSIITAEATGESWMQRNWRPITMLTFLGLVVCDSFGWLANPLAGEAWTLLQIGLGGYVTSRGVEKVVSKLKAGK
jgi:hypothetical protein